MTIVNENAGKPGTTLKITLTDTAQDLLTALSLSSTKAAPVTGILLTPQDYALKYAYTATPVQGSSGLGHVVPAGSGVMLKSLGEVQNCNVINAVNGADCVLTATPFYGAK
jgi:hypothetical protein